MCLPAKTVPGWEMETGGGPWARSGPRPVLGFFQVGDTAGPVTHGQAEKVSVGDPPRSPQPTSSASGPRGCFSPSEDGLAGFSPPSCQPTPASPLPSQGASLRAPGRLRCERGGGEHSGDALDLRPPAPGHTCEDRAARARIGRAGARGGRKDTRRGWRGGK